MDIASTLCVVSIVIVLIVFLVFISLYYFLKDDSSNIVLPEQEYQNLEGVGAPQLSVPPTDVRPQIIKEKEIIKEIIKVKCPYCGALIDQGLDTCPHCGAPLR